MVSSSQSGGSPRTAYGSSTFHLGLPFVEVVVILAAERVEEVREGEPAERVEQVGELLDVGNFLLQSSQALVFPGQVAHQLVRAVEERLDLEKGSAPPAVGAQEDARLQERKLRVAPVFPRGRLRDALRRFPSIQPIQFREGGPELPRPVI